MEIPGSKPSITPLRHGRYFFGRAARKEDLSKILKDFTGISGWFFLPKGNEPRYCLPAGWLNIQGNTFILCAGWPREVGESLYIYRNNCDHEPILIKDTPYQLMGFEKIDFLNQPPCSMLYIPPISSYSQWLAQEQVKLLEELSLWGSAGWGWSLLGEFQNAVNAFEKALGSSVSLDLHYRLLLFSVQVLRKTKESVNLSRAEEYERKVLEYLQVPLFEINMEGKVFQYGESADLNLSAFNLSNKYIASDLSIKWHCPELLITKRFEVGDVPPRDYISPQRFRIISGSVGRYPVHISMTYRDQNGVERLQEVTDYIKVRKPRAKVGGDVLILGGYNDPDDIPKSGMDMVIINRFPNREGQ